MDIPWSFQVLYILMVKIKSRKIFNHAVCMKQESNLNCLAFAQKKYTVPP